MGDEKQTVEMEKVPAWAISLSERMAKGFSELRGDVTLLVEEGKATNTRLGVLEHRVSAIEEAKRNDSIPVKVGRVSENDSKQDAILADHTVRLEAIETKTDAQTVLLTDMKSFAAKLSRNPVVVGLLTAAATAATAWLAARGGHP